MNQAEKDFEDWHSILSGQSVSADAKPEIVLEAKALRVELECRRNPSQVNPNILENILAKTGLKPPPLPPTLWERLQEFLFSLPKWFWGWRVGLSFATSILISIIVLDSIIPSEPKMKDPEPIPQNVTASNPQAKAKELEMALENIGISVLVRKRDKDWIVKTVPLSKENSPALSDLLEQFDSSLVLPPIGEPLVIRISEERK